VNRILEIGAGSELSDELKRRSHGIERGNLQHAWIVQVDRALILIFLQQRLQHGPCLRTVPGKDIALTNVIGAFPPGQRRLIERYMANQVERIQVLAQFIGQRVQRQPFGFQFVDNGLLAVGGLPPAKKAIQL
jgi:hypothetical protein